MTSSEMKVPGGEDTPAPNPTSIARWWREFWFAPVSAERLALLRITTAIALLGDIFLQQLPHYGELYGSLGLEPEGHSDELLLRSWRWTPYVLQVSGTSLAVTFVLWVIAAVALGLGLFTRWSALVTWFLTLALFHRHYHLKNFGDSVLRVSLFLLLFVPSSSVFSLDVWRRLRRWPLVRQLPWGVRLFQLQLCVVYTSTGLSKIVGPLDSTWYQGTSLHYALNDFVLGRWSYASLPVPLWVTLPLSYLVLVWELFFVPLVAWRRTRAWTLAFGVFFHLTVFLLLEVGWFSFYILCWYCAWIPDRWFVEVFYPKLRRWTGVRSVRS